MGSPSSTETSKEQQTGSRLRGLVGDKSTANPAAAVRDAVLLNGRTSDDLALLVLQFTRIDIDRQQIDATARQKKWRFHSSDVYAAHAAREELMKFVRLFSDDDEPCSPWRAELSEDNLLLVTFARRDPAPASDVRSLRPRRK